MMDAFLLQSYPPVYHNILLLFQLMAIECIAKMMVLSPGPAIQETFTPFIRLWKVDASPEGSARRRIEEGIHGTFTKYCRAVFGMCTKRRSLTRIICPHDLIPPAVLGLVKNMTCSAYVAASLSN